MTEKPYAEDDVNLVAGWFRRWLGASTIRQRDRDSAVEILDMLAAAGRLAPVDDDPRHIIEFRPDGWTIQHPLPCRPNLFDCPVNRAAEQQVTAEPATGRGRYVCWLHEDDGLLVLGDRVDQAEGCPCLPGAPEHIHGVGGYAPTEG